MSTTNPFYLLPLFAAALVVYAARRIEGPPSRAFRMFAIVGTAALVTRTALVLLGPVSPNSVVAAFVEGLRLAVLLSIFGAMNSVCDPFALLRLAPRRFYEPALAAALALSLAPRTIEAAVRVREAQRLRGIDVGRWTRAPALALPVLETGMEEAVTLAESMDARGHGRGPRSRYRTEPWGLKATVVTVVAVCSVLLFGVFSRLGDGDLVVSTSPLEWPRASGWLIAATLAFALPAFVGRDANDPAAGRP